MADKLNRVGIKIPAELHHEIDIESATTRTPIYVLIEKAWRAYQKSESTGTHSTKSPQKGLEKQRTGEDIANSQEKNRIDSSGYSEWVNMLEAILQSGHAVAIEAITRNLYAFDMLIHTNEEAKVEGYPVRTLEEIHVDITKVLKRHRKNTAA